MTTILVIFSANDGATILSKLNVRDKSALGHNRPSKFPRNDSDHIFYWLNVFISLVLVVATACAAVTATSTLPITEGWYESLIFFEKHGLMPYTNIEFVLPPMTIVYFRIFDFLTGSNFFGTKLLGVGLTLINCGLLFVWLGNVYSKSAVALSAAISFVILTTYPVYIASDYHDLGQFFTTVFLIIALYSGLYRNSSHKIRLLFLTLFLGASAQTVFLTKQNIGLGIVGAYLLFSIVYTAAFIFKKKWADLTRTLLNLMAFVTAFLLTGVLLLRVARVSQPYFSFIHYLLTIQSKGSPLYAATRLLHDTNNIALLLPAFVLSTAAVFLFFSWRYLLQITLAGNVTTPNFSNLPIPSSYFTLAKAIIFITIPLIGFKFALDQMLEQDTVLLWNYWPSIFALSSYLVDVFITISAAIGGPRVPGIEGSSQVSFARITLFGAIVYANSLTASLSVMGVILLFSFYATIAIDIVFKFIAKQPSAWRTPFLFGTSAVIAIFTIRLELQKFQVPYSWWGMQEAPVYSSSVSLNLPYMSGMRFSSERATMLKAIVSQVKANTTKSDPILAFPDIPLIYMLSDRLPMTRTYVQWFDFSTNASLIPDFQHVALAPPKIIVEMSIPQAVFDGHEQLLGANLPQKYFAQYLECMVEKGAFSDINRYYYNRSDALKGAFKLRTAQALSGSEIEQIAAKARLTNSGGAVITGAVGLGDSEISMGQMQLLPDQKTPQFSGISVSGKVDEMPAIIRYLNAESGIKFLPYEDNYIVRILRREPGWNKSGSSCRSGLSHDLSIFG